MTTDEAIKRLRELHEKNGDEASEGAHIEADNILLDLIGDDELREAFKAIRKWYA